MEEEKNKSQTEARESLLQAVKFVLFSISAGVIQTIIFEVFDKAAGWTYWPSYLCALVTSVLWNFTLNRKFTFKAANNIPVAMLKVLAYYCVFTPVSTLWGRYFDGQHMNHELILFATMGVNLTTEFLYDKYIVFRKKREIPIMTRLVPEPEE